MASAEVPTSEPTASRQLRFADELAIATASPLVDPLGLWTGLLPPLPKGSVQASAIVCGIASIARRMYSSRCDMPGACGAQTIDACGGTASVVTERAGRTGPG